VIPVLLAAFAPLKVWLDEQNKGQTVGWKAEQGLDARRFLGYPLRMTIRGLDVPASARSSSSRPEVSR